MKKISELNEKDIISWCEEFGKQSRLHQCPLNDTEARFLIGLNLKEGNLEHDREFLKSLEKEFLYQVIDKRLQLYSYTMTVAAKAALGILFCSNPAQNTMNMTYIQYSSILHKKSVIDVSFLCNNVFPFGKIDKKVYDEFWDKQKVDTTGVMGPDNMLDYPKMIKLIKLANV